MKIVQTVDIIDSVWRDPKNVWYCLHREVIGKFLKIVGSFVID